MRECKNLEYFLKKPLVYTELSLDKSLYGAEINKLVEALKKTFFLKS